MLVTGGAGFIGSNLASWLLERGARVRILDNFSTGRRQNLEDLHEAEVMWGSVVDRDTCMAACEGVEVVYHQAALPSVARSVADPFPTHEAAVTGTLNVLWAARESGVRRVVYAASSSLYGNTAELPKHEGMYPLPRSPYAVSKFAGELYVQVFARVYGLCTVSLRYFNIFGPRQDPTSKYSAAIPGFILKALRDEAPVIDGDGAQTRDFTYVENAVRANVLAATAPEDRVAGRAFNVGAGARTSVVELWRMIKEITGTRAEATHGPARPGDVRDSLADIEAAREAFGYEPVVSLREGLERTVAHLRSHEVTPT